jgi:copper chaperone NosL
MRTPSHLRPALIVLWLLTGCGAAPPGPEPIPLDRVNCARCTMLISSDSNAAQSQAHGRSTRFFDDIGCLAADPEAHAGDANRYVRLVSGAWATTGDAWFARSASVRTPMDYGILAFATADEARAADRDGQAYQWPAIVSFAKSR